MPAPELSSASVVASLRVSSSSYAIQPTDEKVGQLVALSLGDSQPTLCRVSRHLTMTSEGGGGLAPFAFGLVFLTSSFSSSAPRTFSCEL